MKDATQHLFGSSLRGSSVFRLITLAVLSLGLIGCATLDDDEYYGEDDHYEEGHYDDGHSHDGHSHNDHTHDSHSHRHRSSRRSYGYGSYSRYYPGSYYDPYYNRYYSYGRGSYGAYGYYRPSYGYYCPVHSGYYGRRHYNSHDHRPQYRYNTGRDRNARIEPNTGPVHSNQGNDRGDTRRGSARPTVRTPRSGLDGVLANRTTAQSQRNRALDTSQNRLLRQQIEAYRQANPRATGTREVSDEEIRGRILAQQVEQARRNAARSETQRRQRASKPAKAPRSEPRQERSKPSQQSRSRSNSSRRSRSNRPNRQMH